MKNRLTRKNKKSFNARGKTLKRHSNYLMVHSTTPMAVEILSKEFKPQKISSYSPTINEKLITIRSIPRSKLADCNNKTAFEMREPLKIGVGKEYFGKSCFDYYTEEAKHVLLKNLSANKHIDPYIVVPPVQIDSNCWFNTMFASIFISDKGRKFFHYFRQLMIEGKQADGSQIPDKLRNAFALLNFAVDSALTGNKFAYEMNTNNIIREIYEVIPDSYHESLPYIKDVGEAGNPIRYYTNIINYLQNKSLQLLYISDCSSNWKERINKETKKSNHLPHIIVMEFFDEKDKTAGNSGLVKNKPLAFTSNKGRYVLDSVVVRDKEQLHFCATITCEKKEMGYDGMSFHRLVPLEWKKYINSDFEWSFEGSNNTDGTPLRCNFTHGYQMLIYYRSQ